VQDLLGRLVVPTLLPFVLAAVIGALAAFYGAEYERTRPPVYQSSAVVLLDSPLAITSNPGAVISVSEIRGKYAALVGTDVISRPAASRLGLPPSVVAGSVTASIVPVGLDIALRARGASPEQAQKLSSAVAQSLIDYVKAEQAALPPIIRPDLRLTMSVVGEAPLGYRVSPNHRREITTGAIVGLIAAAVVYASTWATIEVRRRISTSG
jgi:hypothetical protein